LPPPWAAFSGLDEKRVQFTPDLMPADILGSEVLEENERGQKSFRFVPGPVFCQLLMADEINRASPRTQSALLQAMQEHHVTVAGARHDLPQPFHVLATQNPIEQEGTYPLPEAQLDRFIMQIDISYPPLEAERRMLFSTTGVEEAPPANAMSSAELMQAQRLCRTIPVGEQVADAILRVVRAARPGPDASQMVNECVAWGPSPRASQALMLGARAKALIEGRLSPSVEDVAELAGARVQAPHGAELQRPRRWQDGGRCDRAPEGATRLMAQASPDTHRLAQKGEGASLALPPMLVRAEKIAATVILGVHGRRAAGPGETFWQYRPYGFGDSTQRIDWHKSAQADRVFIRENEWESANTLWVWCNTGPRMAFRSHLAPETKRERAQLLALALASLAARAHERIGALGSPRAPGYGRLALLRVAEWLGQIHDRGCLRLARNSAARPAC
jgi:MoxR-like ATPase